jgi:hypothetical protein
LSACKIQNDNATASILDRVRKFCAEYLEELADGLDALPGGP